MSGRFDRKPLITRSGWVAVFVLTSRGRLGWRSVSITLLHLIVVSVWLTGDITVSRSHLPAPVWYHSSATFTPSPCTDFLQSASQNTTWQEVERQHWNRFLCHKQKSARDRFLLVLGNIWRTQKTRYEAEQSFCLIISNLYEQLLSPCRCVWWFQVCR